MLDTQLRSVMGITHITVHVVWIHSIAAHSCCKTNAVEYDLLYGSGVYIKPVLALPAL
jgi:hypothetical protein